jgi:hypothetical protein
MIRPRLALAAAVLIAITACGAATPPGELDPTLRTQLAQVDQALAAGDYPQARENLNTLAAHTATARNEGRITPDQADGILTAIARVAANLPEPTSPAPATAPAQPSQPTATTFDRQNSPENTDTSPEGDTQNSVEQNGNGQQNRGAGENNKGEKKGNGAEKDNGEKSKAPETEGTGNENNGGPDPGPDHGH